MDFTNINDPAGIKALLDQLRASQAWQEVTNSTNSTALPIDEKASRPSISPPTHVEEPMHDPESSPSVSSHISSLLSRLKPGGGISSQSQPSNYPTIPHHHPVGQGSSSPLTSSTSSTAHVAKIGASTPILTTSPQAKSLRSLTFNQALPVIARLPDNPGFLEKLEKMREDQVLLERKLWDARLQILQSQEAKVKVAQAKALIVGAGLTKIDASALESSFLKELETFDSEQALPAWDALITKQQGMLEALGVPSMFVTSLKPERERQQRIVQVLEGLSELETEEVEP